MPNVTSHKCVLYYDGEVVVVIEIEGEDGQFIAVHSIHDNIYLATKINQQQINDLNNEIQCLRQIMISPHENKQYLMFYKAGYKQTCTFIEDYDPSLYEWCLPDFGAYIDMEPD